MQRKNDEWISRIKQVEREYRIARVAMERLIADYGQDSAIIQDDLRFRDVRRAVDCLEGTYVIRLFAEFETGLRSYWVSKKRRKRKTATRAEDLVKRIGSLNEMPDDLISSVHEVREYRNALVHERETEAEAISIPIARTRLCTFFARLPPDW